MKNLHVKLLALALIGIGVSLCVYKVNRLGLPLSPSASTQVWTVEARIAFQGTGHATKVDFTIPDDPPGFSVLDEDFISSGFGIATEDRGVNRTGLWAARNVRGKQVLYYRIILAADRDKHRDRTRPDPDYPAIPDYPEPERSAVFSLLQDVRNNSADISSFTRELIKRFNATNPQEEVAVLREDTDGPRERARALRHILAGARIPARVTWALPLQDGLRDGTLSPYLEVYDGDRWLAFNPQTGHKGFPEDALVWETGDEPLTQVKNARPASVSFSAAQGTREVLSVAKKRARLIDSNVLEFSLFSLPLQTQNVYKVLLTVPLGVFVVVLMRNFVGLATFGTFMPILIALAFRETKLIWGVVLFSTLVALGVMIRFYLERLKLLLVPRLASVVTIVILLMAGVSIISHKLGIERGLSVALFPMVILAMTIERMSVAWDEAGPRDAMTQAMGSLLVAIIGYLVMTNASLTYLVFVFPELLLVLLALMLLAGRYTGYRLSELWRFRSAIDTKRSG